jgi:phosphoglycerate kinase
MGIINNLSIYIDFVDYVRVFLFFKFNNNLKGLYLKFFQINKLKIELMKTLTDFDFKNKKAIIRVDFVPLDENLNVTDATRIERQNLQSMLAHGSVILMSHLGRPKGRRKYSLKHILKTTSAVLGVQVKFVSDCIGQEAENAAAALKSGECCY